MDFLSIVSFVVGGIIIYKIYEDIQEERHPERKKAKLQAVLLEENLNWALSIAQDNDCIDNYNKHYTNLRADLKDFIFKTNEGLDIGDIDSHSAKHMILAIIFYYLSDTPACLEEHNLDKKTVLDAFRRCELYYCFWTPNGTKKYVLKKLLDNQDIPTLPTAYGK